MLHTMDLQHTCQNKKFILREPFDLRDVEFIDLPFIVGAIPAGRPCGNRVISLI